METYQAKCMNEAQKGNSMTELEYYKTREKILEKELSEANDEINRLNFLVAQELMGAPVRNKQMEAELRTLFELIDDEDFNQAREKIASLEKQLGEHEPELTRARSLITFLEGSE